MTTCGGARLCLEYVSGVAEGFAAVGAPAGGFLSLRSTLLLF
jgi:hypothetical protein